MAGLMAWLKKTFGSTQPPVAAPGTPCVYMEQGGFWYCFREKNGQLEICPSSGRYDSKPECDNATQGRCP